MIYHSLDTNTYCCCLLLLLLYIYTSLPICTSKYYCKLCPVVYAYENFVKMQYLRQCHNMIHIQPMLLQNSRLRGGGGGEGCPDMFLVILLCEFQEFEFSRGEVRSGTPPPPTLDLRMISFNFLVKKWGEGRG